MKPITFTQCARALSPEAEGIAAALWAAELLPYNVAFPLAQYTASAPKSRLTAEQFMCLVVQDFMNSHAGAIRNPLDESFSSPPLPF